MLLPPSLYDRPDRLQYVVLFDGTASTPMGRQLFVPEQETRPAPSVRELNARARRFVPQSNDLQDRALRVLLHVDATIAEIAALLKVDGDLARNAVFRLRQKGAAEPVDMRINPLRGEKGQRPYLTVYGVRG